ncbi:hypothetical protein TNCV_515611 [Trichonephila clavipes]|nr:hypothetical protein TNCV_515611 [Trichonephila clavipes]
MNVGMCVAYAFLNRSSDCDETLESGWTHVHDGLELTTGLKSNCNVSFVEYRSAENGCYENRFLGSERGDAGVNYLQ